MSIYISVSDLMFSLSTQSMLPFESMQYLFINNNIYMIQEMQVIVALLGCLLRLLTNFLR